MRVSMLRHGDVLHAFTLETDTCRTWKDLPGKEQEEVKTLISRLGDESYARREEATEELKTHGREILPKLREMVEHEDPEVRARAKEVGIAIAGREYVVSPKLAHILRRKSGRRKPLTHQGFLGVSIANVQQGKLPGALITQVLRNSPAERAGIRLQDVILVIDNQVLDDATDVLEIISAKDPGSVARLRIRRGNQIVNAAATLGARPYPLP